MCIYYVSVYRTLTYTLAWCIYFLLSFAKLLPSCHVSHSLWHCTPPRRSMCFFDFVLFFPEAILNIRSNHFICCYSIIGSSSVLILQRLSGISFPASTVYLPLVIIPTFRLSTIMLLAGTAERRDSSCEVKHHPLNDSVDGWVNTR